MAAGGPAATVVTVRHTPTGKEPVACDGARDRAVPTVIVVAAELRRGHYELGVEARHRQRRVAAAFDELARAI